MLFSNNRNRRGFTITEILIAVLLVLILSAIAVPRLLGNQRQADDTSAKAQLRTAAEVARNLMYEAGGNFSRADVAQMTKDEPNIQFVDETTASSVTGNRRSVSVRVTSGVGTNDLWIGAATGGQSGGKTNCWYVKLDARGADQYYVSNTATSCTAASAPASTTQNTATSGADANGWVTFDFPLSPTK